MDLIKVRAAFADILSGGQIRRILRSASWLMAGTVLGGVLSLGAILVAAGHLGPEKYGALALITTYVMLVDRLLNFQTWQGLIRYGAAALHDQDRVLFGRLVRICTLLDAGSALAGTGIAVAGAGAMARLFELGPGAALWTALYAVVILTNLSGVPIAVLRLHDRFGLLAVHEVLHGAVALAAVMLAIWLEAALLGVLAALAAGRIAGNLFLLAAGWRELARQEVREIWKLHGPDALRPPPGFLGFVFWTNVESSVKILRETDVFIVKAMLDLESVGLYHAARRIANAVNGAIAPLSYALAPELAKLTAAGDSGRLGKLMLQVAATGFAVAAMIFVLFLIFGEHLLAVTLGIGFAPAFHLTVLCLTGILIWSVALPLAPAMFSLGLPRKVFWLHLLTAVAYLSLLLGLVQILGLAGAGWAYLSLFILWAVMVGGAFYQEFRRLDVNAIGGLP